MIDGSISGTLTPCGSGGGWSLGIFCAIGMNVGRGPTGPILTATPVGGRLATEAFRCFRFGHPLSWYGGRSIFVGKRVLAAFAKEWADTGRTPSKAPDRGRGS